MLMMSYPKLTESGQTESSKCEGGSQLERLLHKNMGIFLTIMIVELKHLILLLILYLK